ncbi:hypothetical protein OKW43_008599 [Paraburkholderia sp. WC7.3g]|uniref:hypothetical protein n=1 Tax=Paraburkholderia sp. WC7.3g TaxID=2991070 RepID=UPI003D252132
MNRQERIDSKVAELFDEFEARLHALGFTTSHEPARDGEVGTLIYEEVRRDGRSYATCEDTGAISEWFDKELLPSRQGLYQVRHGEKISFAAFDAGAWEGGAPDAWRGIDWRISKEERNRLYAILRDRKHGSKPDAALALIRHHLCSRSNERATNTLRDEFGIKEKVYYGVIMRKDPEGARQIGHLVEADVLSEAPPPDIRDRISHRIETFDHKRE